MKIFMELNYLLILGVAAINFVFGGIWHSPKVFGKMREEQTGVAMIFISIFYTLRKNLSS